MQIAKSKLFVLVVLQIAYLMFGCFGKPEPIPTRSQTESQPMSTPNAAILAEADRAGTWFHAKKVRPIRARKLEQDETIQTLEGPVQANAGSYLCRGEAGEPWPQSTKSLYERYSETNDVDAEGWRKFVPRPDAEGVMAAKIDHPFAVEATWGKLTGKAGDYLLKKFTDRDSKNPTDVWIVDATLFQATYAPVD